ncbi:MAG: dihydroorotase [Bacteroidia bacterium]|nr:dihydroorotase [Bacteroidia bacterium]
MNLLIKSVHLVDNRSPLNGKQCDIHISQGIIRKIALAIRPESCGKDLTIVRRKGLHVSIGWFDLGANFCDPGFEYKEDILSGIEAAIAGGYTGVMLLPNTVPVIQNKEGIEYIRNKSRNNLVEVFPAGALTADCQGKELTEYFDMKSAGAVAFTDGKHTIADSGSMLRALQYAQNCNSPVIVHADDKCLSGKLLMNESENSVLFGIKGSPGIAEEVMVQRDIRLAHYADSRIHFLALSSAGSVELIRKAKKHFDKITAGVTAYQICFDDSCLSSYNTNFKLNPPLRTKADIAELIKGLADDTIDVIISDHTPEDIESKQVEFELARYGMIGLETAFAAVNTVAGKKLGLEKLVEKISIAPRKVLGLVVPEIKEGENANLTLFDPNEKWTFTRDEIHSRSANTPFFNTEFTGRVAGVVLNKNFTWISKSVA